MRSLLRQGLPYWLSFLSLTLYVWADGILLSLMASAREVGWYNAAVQVIASLGFLPYAVTMAVFPARRQTRHLLAVKNLALCRCRSWTSIISLPAQTLQELQWWHRQLQSWNGKSFLPSTPLHEVFTDASDQSWG